LAKLRVKFWAEFVNLQLGVKLYKAPKLRSKEFGPEVFTNIAKMAGYEQFIPPTGRFCSRI
jgi:hypothetical protein